MSKYKLESGLPPQEKIQFDWKSIVSMGIKTVEVLGPLILSGTSNDEDPTYGYKVGELKFTNNNNKILCTNMGSTDNLNSTLVLSKTDNNGQGELAHTILTIPFTDPMLPVKDLTSVLSNFRSGDLTCTSYPNKSHSLYKGINVDPLGHVSWSSIAKGIIIGGAVCLGIKFLITNNVSLVTTASGFVLNSDGLLNNATMTVSTDAVTVALNGIQRNSIDEENISSTEFDLPESILLSPKNISLTLNFDLPSSTLETIEQQLHLSGEIECMALESIS